MAQYLYVKDTNGLVSKYHVPAICQPTYRREGDVPVMEFPILGEPGAVVLEIASIAGTWFEKKRNTPARDAKAEQFETAKQRYHKTLDEAAVNFQVPADRLPEFENTIAAILDARTAYRKTQDVLLEHDENAKKARAPRTPKVPKEKPAPAPKKKSQKKSA